jgi:hypothetical protein
MALKGAPSKPPRPPALWPGEERRPLADYRRLAGEILAHPDYGPAWSRGTRRAG